MAKKCKHCGETYYSDSNVCPYCRELQYDGKSEPTTIAELKLWAEMNNLPLEEMRVFIGINTERPKAYGIYRTGVTGEYIVYKNKADGTTSIRYKGESEIYAVNELYQKMRERIREQKEAISFNTYEDYAQKRTTSLNSNSYNSHVQSKKRNVRSARCIYAAMWGIVSVLFIASFIFGIICVVRQMSDLVYSSDVQYDNTDVFFNGDYFVPVPDYQYDDWYYEDDYYYEDEYDYPYDDPYYDDDYYYGNEYDSGYYDTDDYYYDYYSYDYDDYSYDYDDSWDSYDSWDSSYDDWDSDW